MKKPQGISKKYLGFTIVELLVVIVVIGILAAIITSSYTNMTSKARAATLQSDLKNASTKIEIYKAENGTYPAEGSDFVNNLPKSSSTTYTYVLDGDEYHLTATTSAEAGLAYNATNGTVISEGAYEETLGYLSISAGIQQSCAISSNNTAYCWGDNTFGNLGDGSTNESHIPVAVDTTGVLSGKTVTNISTSDYHTCAVASNNVYCWGLNDNGQLGNNSTSESHIPVAVDTTGVLSGKTVTAVDAGSYHTCVIASDNNAYCWGDGTYGRLGNSSTADSSIPVAVDRSGALNGKTILSISSGGFHTCAIASDSNAYCWGYNSDGQLGDGSTTLKTVPTAVNSSGVLSGKTMSTIGAGGAHTCATTTDGNAYCWGYNSVGQLGNNSTTDSPVPVSVSTSGVLSGKTVTSISLHQNHTCAIDSSYGAYCWGYNDYGELGDGTINWSTVPVQVTSL